MPRVIVLMGVIVLGHLAAIARAVDGSTTAPGVLEFEGEQATIPLMRGGSYFFVEVTLNGQDAGLFILDTGASHIFIDRQLAVRLNLPYVATSQAGTTSVTQASTVHAINSLAVGNVILSRTFGMTLDLSRLTEELKLPINGVIGGTFFGAAPHRFSAREATLTIYRRSAFAPPKEATRSELRISGTRPYVKVDLESVISEWFLIDTGSGGTVLLDPIYSQLRRADLVDRPWTREFAVGGGGLAEFRRVRFAHIDTLGTRFDRKWAGYSVERPQSGGLSAGHIGMVLLGHFDLTFDYQAKAVWSVYHSKPVPVEWSRADFDPRSTDLVGDNALLIAAREGWTEDALRFLNSGVDAKWRDRTGFGAVHWAAGKGDIELLKALLAAGADPKAKATRDITPLHMACESSSLDTVQLMLEAGAGVNEVDVFGRTPLIVAAENGHGGMASALIKAGADIHLVSTKSGTALHAAATRGSVESVRVLLDAGADPNAPTTRETGGRNALSAAAHYGRADVVALLLARGADVNFRDLNSQTALIAAVAGNEVEPARLLLVAGADPSIFDKTGSNALQIAAKAGNVELMSLLYRGTNLSTTRPAGE